MGRPRELTEQGRQKLIAEGYRPVEVWVLDQSTPEFQRELERMCREIRESDQRSDMSKTLDAFLEDVWDDFS
jgi:hypothetical protein